MGEVKVYRITGRMMLAHDKLPEWRKFSIEATAVKPEHAVEKILSELGSRHKLRRKHIVIEKIEEIPLENVENPQIRLLLQMKGWKS